MQPTLSLRVFIMLALPYEIWRDIPWYAGKYRVSNLGRVIKNGAYIALHNHKWYRSVSIWGKTKSVHRLVWQLFICNPVRKPCINHKNWVKHDNRVDNLEWCTISENILHKFRVLKYKVTDNARAASRENVKKAIQATTKPLYQYSISWEFIKEWNSQWQVQRVLWIRQANISKCCLWLRSLAWGYRRSHNYTEKINALKKRKEYTIW